MIAIPKTELERMHRHVVETYPEEGCGFLIGRDGDRREVTEVRPTKNVHPEMRETRYTVDPREVLKVDRELRGQELAHLGFFHSHPDHPPRPSQFDLEHAWPYYTYLIVRVVAYGPKEAHAWRLDEEHKSFKEEPLVLQ